jgi:hypothetical protein
MKKERPLGRSFCMSAITEQAQVQPETPGHFSLY